MKSIFKVKNNCEKTIMADIIIYLAFVKKDTIIPAIIAPGKDILTALLILSRIEIIIGKVIPRELRSTQLKIEKHLPCCK